MHLQQLKGMQSSKGKHLDLEAEPPRIKFC